MPVSRAAYDDKELEEERRLLYVAITRARERLFLTRSRSRYLYGKRSMTLPSRFLNELSSVMDIQPQGGRSDYSFRSYAGGRSGYSGSYTGYGARRSFSRTRSSDEEEYGYHSDLPPEPQSAPSPAFSAASAFKRTQAAGGKPGKSGGKDYSAFRAGVKVRHPKFGEGLIVSTRGEGSALIANISFPGLGIKALSVQIAPLTIIQ